MQRTIFIAALVLLTAAPVSFATAADTSLTAAEWREDLQTLARELPRVHPNPFHRTTEIAWRAAVAALDSRMPSLDRDQRIVELMRIVAMIGEGHTAINPLFNPPSGFHYLPIRPYVFSDGLYVRLAAPEQSGLAGAKILRIGNVAAEDALRLVSAVTSHDNDSGARNIAPLFLAIPEVLHGLGIIEDAAAVPLLLEKDGRVFDVTLKDAALLQAPPGHAAPLAAFRTAGWTDAAPQAPRPLWLRDPMNLYWTAYDAGAKVAYIQYNAVADKPDDPISAFFPRAIAAAESGDATRLVIDIRQNLGGNSFLNRPIVKALIRSRFDQRGRLFVIIGRGTFSAAQNLVNDLANWTNALFVGEPTASNPNQYGDHTMITLPHSGIVVAVSTLYHQTAGPTDHRDATVPQLPAMLTFADYRNGVDPAMATVARYRSITDALDASLSSGVAADVEREYRAFKSSEATAWIPTEGEVNGLGYRLLNAHKVDLALLVFRLNAESYPQSANVHDSLGEAYLAAGDRQNARASYERALALNPHNDGARQILAKLQESP
ncbi:MAG TPA: tetratricopeptide repeat protein [Thermoanaerobaculia bacterium]|nr:tetratricopeptide repeat protein [Thermoanaerobaculia bacterium]